MPSLQKSSAIVVIIESTLQRPGGSSNDLEKDLRSISTIAGIIWKPVVVTGMLNIFFSNRNDICVIKACLLPFLLSFPLVFMITELVHV